MQPLRLCTFLAFIAVLSASEPSKKVSDFVSIVNGDYDNKEQTQEDGDDHPFVQVRLIPVDIKCLRPNGQHVTVAVTTKNVDIRIKDPVLFVEEALNGVIRVLNLAGIKDGINDTISENIYNFTDHTKYKPGEYHVENLSNFSCGDLQGDGHCIGSYQVSSNGNVFGDYPLCRGMGNQYVWHKVGCRRWRLSVNPPRPHHHEPVASYGQYPLCSITVNKKHPRFTTMHTCDTFSGTVPVNSDQASPVEPYELRLTRKKYSLVNTPKDYVAPCGK